MTLAERLAAAQSSPAPPSTETDDAAPSPPKSGRARGGPRHCWVEGVTEHPGRWPGLLVEWRPDDAGSGWHGRVAYVVRHGHAPVLVEAWLPARCLTPR